MNGSACRSVGYSTVLDQQSVGFMNIILHQTVMMQGSSNQIKSSLQLSVTEQTFAPGF